MARAAICYMYGSEFPGDCYRQDLESIHEFAGFGTIAEKYEIVGFPELVLKPASPTRGDRLSDGAKLGEFISTFKAMISCYGVIAEGNGFVVKIVGEHVTTPRKRTVFHELLDKSHQLAINIFSFWAEKQSPVEGGSEDLEWRVEVAWFEGVDEHLEWAEGTTSTRTNICVKSSQSANPGQQPHTRPT